MWRGIDAVNKFATSIIVNPIQKCEEIVAGYKDAPAVRFNVSDPATPFWSIHWPGARLDGILSTPG